MQCNGAGVLVTHSVDHPGSYPNDIQSRHNRDGYLYLSFSKLRILSQFPNKENFFEYNSAYIKLRFLNRHSQIQTHVTQKMISLCYHNGCVLC